MSIFAIIINRLLGRQRNYEHANEVAEQARDLSEHVKVLTNKLRPYTEAEDPLVALMMDAFNTRNIQGVNATKGARRIKVVEGE